MTKMHLIARVPNEGARRLAWCIGDQRWSIEQAAHRIGCNGSTVERLLTGEIVPGGALAATLLIEFGIARTDWQRPALGGWFDRPAEREALAA